ncbi:MAG TPA: phage tail protein [Thermoanaerobaculia bacterium]|nr:phage tail protein [Thermoanaerobaculia bacterium]
MAAPSHLFLDQRAGWRAADLAPSLGVDGEGRLVLSPLPGSGRQLAEAGGGFGGLTPPRGAATSAGGDLYLLAGGEEPAVLRFDPCACAFEPLACVGGKGSEPRQLDDPHGLAVTPGGDLWIADSGNRRLQVFSLKGLALRRIVADPKGAWRPWDVAVGPRGAVYVSDPDQGIVHRLDLSGRFRGTIATEKDGAPLHRPTRLAVDCTGRLYVAQEERSYVAVFAADGTFRERLERREQAAGRFRPLALAVDPEGNLFVTCFDGCRTRVDLFRADGHGGHRGCGRPVPARGSVVGFDAAGKPLAVDGAKLSVLEPAVAFETEGSYRSQALDSRLYRCPWHRVVLAGRVERGTRIRVETFTSEAEKSDEEIELLTEDRWQLAAVHAGVEAGEWDCLVQSPPGRYLWLRLTFEGDGAATPVLGHVRVEYPRSSSLERLPAVYQEDAESRAFLDRWLSIFDTLSAEVAGTLDDLPRLFDPEAAPAGEDGGQDFLTWLAGWMGLALDRHLPLERRRRLLAEAHRLYRLRGTLEGLKLHLELYTGIEPRVLEHFRLRRWLYVGGARLGDCAELFGPDLVDRLQLGVHSTIGDFQLVDSGDPVGDPFAELAHRFTVYVPRSAACGAAGLAQLRRVVELAKPAHTEGEIELVLPRFAIGLQARVGVNTAVGRWPQGVRTGEGRLGQGTVLGPSAAEAAAPTLTVGVRSRIGASTLID